MILLCVTAATYEKIDPGFKGECLNCHNEMATWAFVDQAMEILRVDSDLVATKELGTHISERK